MPAPEAASCCEPVEPESPEPEVPAWAVVADRLTPEVVPELAAPLALRPTEPVVAAEEPVEALPVEAAALAVLVARATI